MEYARYHLIDPEFAWFKAPIGLQNPMSQIIASRYLPAANTEKADRTIQIPLSSSEDKLVILENTPAHWQRGDRVLVLVHGLTGCSYSAYNLRLTHRFLKKGVKVIRVNLRGCGQGFGLSKSIYHSGQSQDIRDVVVWIEKNYGNSPVTLAGMSLGGNIVLKMVGEDGSKPSGCVDSVVAVSPPIDLAASSNKLMQSSRLLNWYFLSRLQKDILKRKKHFDLEGPSLEGLRYLWEFDEVFTAPEAGFLSAKEYYEKSSSKKVLGDICVPTLFLTSQDDPCIDVEAFLKIPQKRFFDVIVTSRGGHVGFVGVGQDRRGFHWFDGLLERFVLSL